MAFSAGDAGRLRAALADRYRVHDSGEADGLLYFVMPYVKGETLRTDHEEGFRYGVELHSDPDLLPLRGDPLFEEFMRPRE